MNANAQVVVIARVLLPAGLEPLRERFEVREGGIEATRDEILAIAPGASALVADPSVATDAELLDACGDGLRVVANFAVGYDNVRRWVLKFEWVFAKWVRERLGS